MSAAPLHLYRTARMKSPRRRGGIVDALLVTGRVVRLEVPCRGGSHGIVFIALLTRSHLCSYVRDSKSHLR